MVYAIVLAAGKGKRLRPITETRPKAMIPVLCKPLLEWHLEALIRGGVERIFVVVSYMKEYIAKYLEARGLLNKVELVDQGEPRGTGDAVIKASEVIGAGEDVVITYSDIFVGDWDLLVRIAQVNENTVVGVSTADPRDYGVVYAKGAYLSKIVEKPREPGTALINAGIYRLNTRDILENRDVPLSPRGEIELTDIINRIATQKPIRVLAYGGEWIDIGKPWHILDANKIALRKAELVIKGEVLNPASLKGHVHVDEGSVIYPYTVIEGPVYIGRNVEIGPHAYIRPWSVICNGSRIGFSVEVKESVLFENVHSHHLAYIGDSIICENVNLGAGTILANLRLDGKTIKVEVDGVLVDTGRRKLGAIIGANVKTGVNVSIMPGVRVGSNSWILPGSVVYEDVPSNTIYPQRPY